MMNFQAPIYFLEQAEKVIVVVKNTYRHPNILNTMMMLQNIEQMKVELNVNSFIYTFILHMYLMKSRFLVG